jgi:hypothetical protein
MSHLVPLSEFNLYARSDLTLSGIASGPRSAFSGVIRLLRCQVSHFSHRFISYFLYSFTLFRIFASHLRMANGVADKVGMFRIWLRQRLDSTISVIPKRKVNRWRKVWEKLI